MKNEEMLRLKLLLVLLGFSVLGYVLLNPELFHRTSSRTRLRQALLAEVRINGSHHHNVLAVTDDFGTNGIPLLVKLLSAKDSNLTIALQRLLDKQPILKVHFARASDWRRLAVFAFTELDYHAKEAIPSLIVLLADKDVGPDAARALGGIGSPAEGPLTSALTNRNPQVRVNAAEGLKTLKRLAPYKQTLKSNDWTQGPYF